MNFRWALCAVLVMGSVSATPGAAEDLNSAIAKLRAVGANGQGNAAASAAWPTVAAATSDQLTTVLAGMDGIDTLAENWFRAAVETIADRQLKATGKLPVAQLETFLFETEHAPRARRLAYELIERVEPTAPERLLPKLRDDPSLELRREAVARELTAAAAAQAAIESAADKPAAQRKAAALYQAALDVARDLDQVKVCTEALAALDKPVDTAAQLGFITDWHVIGPFDNTGKQGFNVAYPPEKAVELDAKYPGKLGEVAWITYQTDDPYGMVDLTKALDKHKGAVAYAAAKFYVDQPRPVQLRLGSIVANKAWVNGKQVFANEVYHAGERLDQYIGEAMLQPGENTILLKICQNEQEESWAQGWQFQLRVTDALGGAVTSSPAK